MASESLGNRMLMGAVAGGAMGAAAGASLSGADDRNSNIITGACGLAMTVAGGAAGAFVGAGAVLTGAALDAISGPTPPAQG